MICLAEAALLTSYWRDFWKHGPHFLTRPSGEWPKQPALVDKSLDESKDSENDSESKDEVLLYFAQISAMKYESVVANRAQAMAAQETAYQDPLGLAGLLERCSSLQTIRGVITRIKRLAKKEKASDYLSHHHLMQKLSMQTCSWHLLLNKSISLAKC